MPVPALVPITYNSDKPGTKTELSRVDTSPHGVKTLAEVRI